MPKNHALLRTVIAIYFVSTLYFLFYYNYGVNFWDEGVPLSGALRLAQGERPTVDFTAYPPGRYYLYLIALNLFDGSVDGPRIMMACVSGLIALMIFWIGYPLMGARLSLLPILFYLLMPIQYYYRFLTFFLLVFILVISHSLTKFNVKMGIFIGLGAASILWFREVLGVLTTVCMLGIAVYKIAAFKKKRLTLELLPLLILGVSWVLKITYMGGVRELVNLYLYSYGVVSGGRSDMSLPWPKIWSWNYWQEFGFFYGMQDILIWMASAILLSGIICGFRYFKSQHKWWILVFGSSIGYGLVLWRTGFGNLLRVFPPFAIIWTAVTWSQVCSAQGFSSKISKKFSKEDQKHPSGASAGRKRATTGSDETLGTNRGAWGKYVFRSLYVFFLVVILMDSIVVNPLVYDSIGIRSEYNASFSHPKMSIICAESDSQLLKTVTEHLEKILQESESLVCLPFHTHWNFLTGALNPTQYEWLLPGMLPDSEDRKEMIEEFQRVTPDVFLLNDSPFDGSPQRAFSRQYPELFWWIEREYYRWMKINEFEIFNRNHQDAIHLLSPENLNAAEFAEGTNRVDELSHFDQKWSILWQQGNGSIGFKCALGPASVLKTGVMIDLDQSSDYSEVEFTVSILTSDQNKEQIYRTQLNNMSKIREEILVYLTNTQSVEGTLILETNQASDMIVGWIDPQIFIWPDIKPSFDTASLSL